MKFMLRLKQERQNDVILPKQYYYSMSVQSEISEESLKEKSPTLMAT